MGILNWFSNTKEKEIKNIELNHIDFEKRYVEVINELEKHKRTAYIPITKLNNKSFSTDSKYGGYPYLRNENDWPICENCNLHMQLFLQLNLNNIPVKKENGLIQLFYCTNSEKNCESELESFFPFSKAVECRKIKIENEPIQIEPNLLDVFDEKLIIDWEEKNDYPHFEEYELLKIEVDIENEVNELMEERNKGLTISEDKLFGFPYWVQSEEYPYDRKTETRMELLFQIGESENIPYMFQCRLVKAMS
jgi:uncharacterized protein YwqG